MIIALAAVLWLTYLVPTWLRRREYLATERNALRLQQTLRIMAETAEMPREVRVEASARDVVKQERVLRMQLNQAAATAASAASAAAAEARDVAHRRDADRRLATTKSAIAADVAVTSSASRRLRRSRASSSILLVAGIASVGAGTAQLVASGSWTLLAVGSAVALGSLATLGRLASVGRARAELARSLRTRPPVVVEAPRAVVVPDVAAPTTWTPVPVPKPLYMSRPAPERTLVSSLEAAAELRQAAADAERRLREAHGAAEIVPIRPAAVVPSRFAGMGFVEAPPDRHTDLDAVLRRRRA